MKINGPASPHKTAWQDNKAFTWFLLSLLLIYSVLKIVFYNYNQDVLFNGADAGETVNDRTRLIKWALLYDGLCILAINTAMLLALQAGRLVNPKISGYFILPLFALINSFAVLLNLGDIFYFRFHFQRANADLLYVLAHPFKQLLQLDISLLIAFTAAVVLTGILMWVLHRRFYRSFSNGNHCKLITLVLVTCTGLLLVFKSNFSRILVPAFPLVNIKSNQLPVVQNSFHTFFYSVFRKGGQVKEKAYFSRVECDSLFRVTKMLHPVNGGETRKNVVLFIMESVPYDFFDTASPYKVQMPFFDSLLTKSIFYNNAFAYSHESNKGITAILAGVPTLTDIPLYHSQYVNMPVTGIGRVLKKNGYHSFFCIGDDYDNFGFAKCMNWLGIDEYYCKDDIPGHKKLPAHSMGLQDEAVLPFVLEKINRMEQPFFAANYNISTHYPYDLPASFSARFPKGYTDPMKSMRYYDACLQLFFSAAAKESWFSNTVFLFCSDHWLVPDDNRIEFTAITGYRIPIIIYDPSVNERKVKSLPVSQFDIMGTILSLAGYKDSIISYGGDLLDSNSINGLVFARPNNSLYQVTDSNYVLGFNIVTEKAEYLYDHRKDPKLSENLMADKNSAVVLNRLTRQVKAFIQQAGIQYNSRPR